MKKVFVAATRQNDGKTTVSLGLLSALQARLGMDAVGYMKPVGQRYVIVDGFQVDEDADLIREVCNIKGSIGDMSPVAIPQGFTENYIKDPQPKKLEQRIEDAFARASIGRKAFVLEGTGHAGVGSVCDISNARVAKLLGAKVVLVSSGGIGKPIDELMMNRALFEARGVQVVGAIVNKVQPEKYDKISTTVRAGLKRLGVETLGVIPMTPLLSHPTIEQLMHDLKAELLSGENGLQNTVSRMVIGAMMAHDALDWFGPDAMLVTPGNRDDLILAALSAGCPKRCTEHKAQQPPIAGIILTTGQRPHPNVFELVRTSDIPVLLVGASTFDTATHIDRLIVKLRHSDTQKIEMVRQLVQQYVDVDGILNAL